MKTAIEMARECGALGRSSAGQLGIAEACLAGEYDDDSAVQSAIAMHTMRQCEIDAKNADIAELVEALEAAVKILQCLEPQPNISAQGISLTALLAKHGGIDAYPVPA